MASFAQRGDSPGNAVGAALEPSTRAEDAASATLDPPKTLWRSSVVAMGLGQRLAAGSAIGLWLGDAILLAPSRAATGSLRWWTGIGAALFVALTTALAVGAILTSVVVGCNVGPRYKRPSYSAPTTFRGADDAAIVDYASLCAIRQ